jgi:exonuclease VII large subunit
VIFSDSRGGGGILPAARVVLAFASAERASTPTTAAAAVLKNAILRDNSDLHTSKTESRIAELMNDLIAKNMHSNF